MKKLFTALLALALIISSAPTAVFAYTTGQYITDTIYYTLDTDAGTLTFSGTGAMPDCSYNEKNEWSRNASASTIIIEDGITSIGVNNFYQNGYVKNLIIGDSVSVIGDRAFMACKNLSTVDCGGDLKRIGDGSFSSCSSMTEFFFPETLEYVGAESFYNCTKLANIVLPEGIETIYADAFTDSSYYKSLTSGINTLCGYTLQYKGTPGATVNFPANTKVVSIGTLRSSKNVKTVVLPDGVERILTIGIYDLSSLSEITIPDSVTFMGNFCVGYVSNDTYATPSANESFTVKGKGGTVASEYAEKSMLNFECTCTEQNGEYIFFPDCLTGGTAVFGCPYCGKVFRNETVPKAGSHTYGPVVNEEATCTEDGRTYRKCLKCGYETTISSVTAEGHRPDMSYPVVTPATCTERGTISFLCSVCGKECPDKTMYLPAAGHAASEEITIVEDATCTEPGLGIRTCTVCGETVETVEIPAAGHDISSKWTVLNQSMIVDKTVVRGFRVKLCTQCGIALKYEYYLCGDINGDEAVNFKDLSLIKRAVSGNYLDINLDNADFNGDGNINIIDLKDMKTFISG